jgi:hypothetical protein
VAPRLHMTAMKIETGQQRESGRAERSPIDFFPVRP